MTIVTTCSYFQKINKCICVNKDLYKNVPRNIATLETNCVFFNRLKKRKWCNAFSGTLFSNKKQAWCMCYLLCHVQLFAALWTVAHRLLCAWSSPGKNTGVGSHFLLKRVFLTQGLNLGLLHCRRFTVLATREALYLSLPAQ